ncbi:3-hydroxyisobutyryl-CoA hydrolase [Tabrizicola sp. J26]|uniref:3-hydroxyisobutyryl-CoA hydrolase n=1 Tax=Alitabrizicola rongguiensis TaxID=2909234 RepID=UPI001F3988C4|nr:3-hydroxyisobutyryl-CoA hydrolase [Tabrizicola rongguiensis]MCF1707945.1 3-hydroxyisobutyryl-CoA hydrolase [Tabrizicola rongguiensis]
MTDVLIRVEGRAGRITLNRPGALNALNHDMGNAISAALTRWNEDPAVALVLIDATGEKAFCAGGDIASIYERLRARDYGVIRQFWHDEYRMNSQIARYPKPIVTFLNGFVMGGGVGVGCHASHRIVGTGSRIAMPETSIGLIPDIGGTMLLASGPGRLGEYLALTAARMTGPDAILAGFADHFIPEGMWPELKQSLIEHGDAAAILAASQPHPPSDLSAHRDEIDRLFAADRLGGILAALAADDSDFGQKARKNVESNAPLAMAAALVLIDEARRDNGLEAALSREYRYVFRSVDQGDFLEGIRARIYDKDNSPRWQHRLDDLPTDGEVAAMLAPLGRDEMVWEDHG